MEVSGFAWAGDESIEMVEVSVDGGATWSRSTLGEPPGRYAWTPWTFEWRPEEPGSHDVLARATDGAGRTQPLSDLPIRTYGANWVHRIRVFVVSSLEQAEYEA